MLEDNGRVRTVVFFDQDLTEFPSHISGEQIRGAKIATILDRWPVLTQSKQSSEVKSQKLCETRKGTAQKQ